jgi:hypothetical protein
MGLDGWKFGNYVIRYPGFDICGGVVVFMKDDLCTGGLC